MALSVTDARHWFSSYQLDQEAKGYSPNTRASARYAFAACVAFCERDGLEFGPAAIRAHLAALRRKEARPTSLDSAYARLRTFCSWLREEGAVPDDLFAGIKRPAVRQDQIQPLSPDQAKDLLKAARGRSTRDRLLILLLLDTGCRVSEACAIRLSDISLPDRSIRIRGKGSKFRLVYYGRDVSRLLLRQIREADLGGDDPLFKSTHTGRPDQGIGRRRVQRLLVQLGQEAHITGVRVSPHTLRHTFAISFLRNGGSPFALKTLLGHTRLEMTQRYVALAQEDIAGEHRRASPGDRLGIG